MIQHELSQDELDYLGTAKGEMVAVIYDTDMKMKFFYFKRPIDREGKTNLNSN